jgi:hypothetical protein
VLSTNEVSGTDKLGFPPDLSRSTVPNYAARSVSIVLQ